MEDYKGPRDLAKTLAGLGLIALSAGSLIFGQGIVGKFDLGLHFMAIGGALFLLDNDHFIELVKTIVPFIGKKKDG